MSAEHGAERSAELYVVATPIGNLEDVTLRALRVLREAKLVACEDTRRTAGLLKAHGIATPTTSYFEHNERWKGAQILDVVRKGADVALVLVDSSEGIVEQDIAVADVARHADCSTLVVLSKWDETTIGVDDVRGELRRRLRQRPPFVAVSSHTGRGLERLLDGIAELFDRHMTRIPTPELNRALAELREARQPPSGPRGRRLNLLYGAQIRVRPPRFRFFVNDPGLVTRDYGYWVENRLRERFGLDGVPVSIDFVRRS